jgi:hypothetical protein
MDSLSRDLEKRIDERLRQWIKDSLDLFDMAGLDGGGYAVLYALLKALASGLHTIGASPNDAAEMLGDIMKRMERRG